MDHWSESYIGQPYVDGEADCANLFAQVSREVFNRETPSALDVVRQSTSAGRAEQLKHAIGQYGQPTSSPKDGDAVLMLSRGRPSHIGVFCLAGGEQCVLHAMKAAGAVVLHRIRGLSRIGLGVEGFYTWK